VGLRRRRRKTGHFITRQTSIFNSRLSTDLRVPSQRLIRTTKKRLIVCQPRHWTISLDAARHPSTWSPAVPRMRTTSRLLPFPVSPLTSSLVGTAEVCLRLNSTSHAFSLSSASYLTFTVVLVGSADDRQIDFQPFRLPADVLYCVQKKTPTHIFFHISMNYLWI